MKIVLVQTCSACPEQYDAFYRGKHVGYLRLRHGNFTVTCPDVGGELVYEARPLGDGNFDDTERHKYLSAAAIAIAQTVTNHRHQIKNVKYSVANA